MSFCSRIKNGDLRGECVRGSRAQDRRAPGERTDEDAAKRRVAKRMEAKAGRRGNIIPATREPKREVSLTGFG